MLILQTLYDETIDFRAYTLRLAGVDVFDDHYSLYLSRENLYMDTTIYIYKNNFSPCIYSMVVDGAVMQTIQHNLNIHVEVIYCTAFPGFELRFMIICGNSVLMDYTMEIAC